MAKVEVKKISEEEKKQLGVENWGVWTSPVTEFPWEYSDQESCYFIEGEVVVKTDEGDYEIKQGDFVVFKPGLKCTWDVKKPVKKYYKFG